MAINELRAIEMFAKAVELGSLRKAATAQGVSPQAASQALAQLEQHLGVRLLHRTTRNIALTDEGQQFLEATQPALAALERAMQRVRSSKDEVSGPLRIVAPRSTFLPVIWPVIDRVLPRTCRCCRPTCTSTTASATGCRTAPTWVSASAGRPRTASSRAACSRCSSSSAHRPPTWRRTARRARWTNWPRTAAACSAIRAPGACCPGTSRWATEVISRDLPPALSTNDTDLECEAVLSGHVIGSLSNLSAAAHIRAGRLVPLLTKHVTDHMSVHIYYGSRSAQPLRVRAFIDMAVEQLADTPDFELGDKELAAAEVKARKALRRK